MAAFVYWDIHEEQNVRDATKMLGREYVLGEGNVGGSASVTSVPSTHSEQIKENSHV